MKKLTLLISIGIVVFAFSRMAHAEITDIHSFSQACSVIGDDLKYSHSIGKGAKYSLEENACLVESHSADPAIAERMCQLTKQALGSENSVGGFLYGVFPNAPVVVRLPDGKIGARC